MNTQNNRRKRESMQRIENAFMQLLEKKELHEVTVSEICKICNLNRSTFYANYEDIYALADQVRQNLELEVSRLYSAEHAQGFNSNDYLRLFRHIRDHQLFYRTYFKLGYADRYQIHFYDTCQAMQYFDNRHIPYHLEFFRCGFNAIVRMWLAGGCRETPEEMEEIVRSEYRGRLSSLSTRP